ncbi:MAG: lytic transglycosylase domain-containing protein [Oligoflexia bacterium]|nr:lytic transglycosylase domain-containing protein [Oligoflexia bacterium]
MSQERWDVVLRFTDGPLSYHGDVVCRGPVVRMGANPGPGGLKIEGYRGLDDRQAVITAYDGGTVAIAPVGTNQVRVAPHGNVDWNEVYPITGPVYLDKDAVCHLGPPGRGASLVFVDCRRLGVWKKNQILSEASQVDGAHESSNVKELDAQGGVPSWFIPATLVLVLVSATALVVPLLHLWQRDIADLGPKDDGQEYYEYVTLDEPVAEALKEGLNQPFSDFIMQPNAKAADWAALGADPEKWDQRYLTYVQHSVQIHLKAWLFWSRLEQIVDDYAVVVNQLRDAGMPEVFAAIPYQESRYRTAITSPACAKGMWQLMPEVAHRMGLGVAGCKLRGSTGLWSPTRLAPPLNVYRNAEYIDPNEPLTSRKKCRITSCQVDERTDVVESTRAAVGLLAEAWNDPELRESGAVVQMTILSHNSGYDDSRFDERGRVKTTNILPGYRKYLKNTNQVRAPDFYGQNILCTTPDDKSKTCGGVLHRETQHYAYSVTAQHILAVCYYAENYGSQPAFSDWRKYIVGDGYCTRMNIPTQAEVRKRTGSKK